MKKLFHSMSIFFLHFLVLRNLFALEILFSISLSRSFGFSHSPAYDTGRGPKYQVRDRFNRIIYFMTKYKSNENQFISAELLTKVLNVEKLHFSKKKIHTMSITNNISNSGRDDLENVHIAEDPNVKKSLLDLEELYSCGFILFEEYLLRKRQITQSFNDI